MGLDNMLVWTLTIVLKTPHGGIVSDGGTYPTKEMCQMQGERKTMIPPYGHRTFKCNPLPKT